MTSRTSASAAYAAAGSRRPSRRASREHPVGFRVDRRVHQRRIGRRELPIAAAHAIRIAPPIEAPRGLLARRPCHVVRERGAGLAARVAQHLHRRATRRREQVVLDRWIIDGARGDVAGLHARERPGSERGVRCQA